MTGHDHEVRLDFDVDGQPMTVGVAADKLLLHTLREDCGVTAPKWGCGTGDCGACSIVLDGQAIDSCLVFAAEAQGSTVQTATGLSQLSDGAIVIEELGKAGAVQCGICTPGFVVAITTGIRELGSAPDHAEITQLLSGNLCRCTGYLPIFAAVRAAASRINRWPLGDEKGTL